MEKFEKKVWLATPTMHGEEMKYVGGDNMDFLNNKRNSIQVLRAVLFIGILAFHAGVPGSQILWGG